jgi:uncharacterized protein (TIGR02145 family)
LATYGYLYNWYSVADPKGLCPSGWHVPSDAEWTTLTSYLGGGSLAGGKLKAINNVIWESPNEGATNESGFSGLPGGYRNFDGKFLQIKYNSFFWSATEYDNSGAWVRNLDYDNSTMFRNGLVGNSNKVSGSAVRCLKDSNSIVSIPSLSTIAITALTTTSSTSGGNITSDGGASITTRGVVWSTSANPTISLSTKTTNGIGTGSFSSTITNLIPKTTYYVRAYATNSAGTGYGNEISFTTKTDSTNVIGIPCPGTPTVKDIDGNTYNTVQIGTQCWTKENLKVSKYNDGTAIPLDTSGGAEGNGAGQTWGLSTTGARAVYANDNTNLVTYGYLYNWYAVKGIVTEGNTSYKNLCPSGWHIPLDAEWTTLSNYLGGESVAGGKMKSMGTTYWKEPNISATNESGFSALPSGERVFGGSFNIIRIRINAGFWSATESGIYAAWYRSLNTNNGDVYRSDNIKSTGFSVRCLRD